MGARQAPGGELGSVQQVAGLGGGRTQKAEAMHESLEMDGERERERWRWAGGGGVEERERQERTKNSTGDKPPPSPPPATQHKLAKPGSVKHRKHLKPCIWFPGLPIALPGEPHGQKPVRHDQITPDPAESTLTLKSHYRGSSLDSFRPRT